MRFQLRSLFLLTAAIAFAVYLLSRWWLSLDGLVGYVFASLGEDTVWAEGYSDDGFRAVRVGMDRSEVYALLGPPLEVRQTTYGYLDMRRQKPGEIVECWTITPHNSNYRVRQIVFKGDVVVNKLSEFYLD